MPEIIQRSNFKIGKALAIGAMTFEAGVGSSNCSVSLSVCSRKFRDDIARVLKKDGLEINQSNIKEKNNKSAMYTITTKNNANKRQIKKFKSYFERNTFKWLKINELENGFSSKVKNEKEMINNLKLFFYKNREINIENILKKCKCLQHFDIYKLIKATKYPRGTLAKYTTFLCKSNIITKTRRKRSNYTFNNKVSEWRVPSTIFHQTLKTQI